MIVLDTNVISELMRLKPSKSVLAWLSSSAAANLYTTTITQSEIILGILLLPSGKRRSSFEQAAETMFREDFAGRVLPFGADAVRPYAEIAARRSQAGRPISQADAQIAGIAHSTGASLATRNTRDFELCGINLIDPWKFQE